MPETPVSAKNTPHVEVPAELSSPTQEASGQYGAEEIQVLEGLESVRKRPGMYIGGTGIDGYHHLLWEVVDNSIDEVINKYASKVEVTLHADGKSATVEANGRGSTVDIMPKFKTS